MSQENEPLRYGQKTFDILTKKGYLSWSGALRWLNSTNPPPIPNSRFNIPDFWFMPKTPSRKDGDLIQSGDKVDLCT